MIEKIKRKVQKQVKSSILVYTKKDFGFIKPLDEKDIRDVFFNKDNIISNENEKIKKGMPVIFDYVEDNKGVHAENVRILIKEEN